MFVCIHTCPVACLWAPAFSSLFPGQRAMEPGTGIWVRIHDGAVVSQAAFDSADKEDRSRCHFVPVPRITWLHSDDAERDLELMMRVSTIDSDAQLASMSCDGHAISQGDLTTEAFAVDSHGRSRRDQLHAHLFPAEACQMAVGVDEALATRIAPLSANHLEQIFGVCRLPSEVLDQWNALVGDAVSRLRRAGDAALLVNEEQQSLLCERGVVPLSVFQAASFDLYEQPLDFEWDQPEGVPIGQVLASPAPIVRPTTFLALSVALTLGVGVVAAFIHMMVPQEDELAGT